MLKKLIGKKKLKRINKTYNANKKAFESSVRKVMKGASKKMHEMKFPIKVSISR